jgi:hypothetical protein
LNGGRVGGILPRSNDKEEPALAGAGGGAAVNKAYTGPIDEASRVLADAVMKNETSLVERAGTLDSTVLELVRQVGKEALEQVLGHLSAQVERDARSRGLTVERRREVKVRTVLGLVAVVSPYLRNRETGRRLVRFATGWG